MSTRRIFALSTYPIRAPRHGGQLRCTALGLHYRNQGHQYCFASLLQGGHHAPDQVSPLDYETHIPDELAGGWAADLAAARVCIEDEGAFNHFRDLAKTLAVDTFVLEHPFLWPLVKELKTLPMFADAQVVYSSHNVESQVKRDVLETLEKPREKIEEVVRGIDELEREIVNECDLVIACTKSDAQTYEQWNREIKVPVLSNGMAPRADGPLPNRILDGKYLVFVGSAHLPNLTGFLTCVLGEGLQYLPHRKQIAVAGGVAELLRNHKQFERRVDSNLGRIELFPEPSDEKLRGLLGHAHGVLLPILGGGGSNLKTAEALLSGKWIIATPMAFRSFEHLINEPGIIIAETHEEFVSAIRKVMEKPSLNLNEAELKRRQSVTWDNILKDFILERHL